MNIKRLLQAWIDNKIIEPTLSDAQSTAQKALEHIEYLENGFRKFSRMPPWIRGALIGIGGILLEIHFHSWEIGVATMAIALAISPD